MSEMSILPNPFSSKWTLKNDPSLPLTVRLIQSTGVVLFTQESSDVLLEFDGETVAPGTYFVEITNRQNGQKVGKRLVKE
ncbi:MAG: T9SS type A sorting domain-containing protein [Crocinitomicaceae bacterium]|nr:T9SS type A sorting domain-containing protein [Crocinitomicaceae bacterium]